MLNIPEYFIEVSTCMSSCHYAQVTVELIIVTIPLDTFENPEPFGPNAAIDH